jgi:hypothetical protein
MALVETPFLCSEIARKYRAVVAPLISLSTASTGSAPSRLNVVGTSRKAPLG